MVERESQFNNDARERLAEENEKLSTELKDLGTRMAALQREKDEAVVGIETRELEIQHLRRRLAELENIVTKDPLTGALNRRGFQEEFRRIIAQYMSEKEDERRDTELRPVTVMIVDIDNFKAINDSRGHNAGDEALKQVVVALQTQTRATDTIARFKTEEGLVGRIGGDELVVLFPGVSEEELLHRFEDQEGIPRLSINLTVEGIPITLSAGIATVLPHETEEEILQRADASLYASKRAGKNRITRYGDLETKE